MKKYNSSGIDTILRGAPANLVSQFKGSLDLRDVDNKLRSRKTLVIMGAKILPYLNKLLKSGDMLIRMEAAKIIELIADKKSIPVLIDLLDDAEFDIRWIAAEALIKLGRRSIKPLLKSVRDRENSILLNESAHHVLMALFNEYEKEDEMSLLQSLDNHHSLGATAPAEASKALNQLVINSGLL